MPQCRFFSPQISYGMSGVEAVSVRWAASS